MIENNSTPFYLEEGILERFALMVGLCPLNGK
nr:hypothetical protein [Bartonella ancashensis]